MSEPIVEVLGARYLIVIGGGGSYHAAAANRTGTGKAAFDGGWRQTTVCGRRWFAVGDPDGDPYYGWKPAVAPDCRACLTIIARPLTPTATDDRIGPLAAAMAQAVRENGSSHCWHVPGDQADRLRSAVRKHLRNENRSVRTLFEDHAGVFVFDRNHVREGPVRGFDDPAPVGEEERRERPRRAGEFYWYEWS